MSTIAAIATGPAPGGLAVIRVSGPRALTATLPLAPGVPPHPQPRQAYLTTVQDRSGRALDEGLLLFFQGPRSFTGEDVVELQLHGSPALASLVLRQVLEDGEVRLAGPGEFTRRAYMNGRIDLLRAEAVAALVVAESEAGVRAAASQLRGAVSQAVDRARAAVEDVLADAEGLLNFPDEAQDAEAGLGSKLRQAAEQVDALVVQARQGRRARRLGRVTLFGPVNAGKSTLFNALLGSNRALVDEAPGTTRDVLEAPLQLEGLAVTLVDTAGLRAPGSAPDRVEAMGIAGTHAALAETDLAVLVLPPEAPSGDWMATAAVAHITVRSKADTVEPAVRGETLWVSGRTGEGLAALRTLLASRLTAPGEVEALGTFSARAEEALLQAQTGLRRAAQALQLSTLEVVAGETAQARRALADALGEGSGSVVLDEVFRRFCIGK